MQYHTPILNFLSGQDLIIILVVLLIPAAFILAFMVIAIARRKENLTTRNTQTMLLNGILEELKKLNSGKS